MYVLCGLALRVEDEDLRWAPEIDASQDDTADGLQRNVQMYGTVNCPGGLLQLCPAIHRCGMYPALLRGAWCLLCAVCCVLRAACRVLSKSQGILVVA